VNNLRVLAYLRANFGADDEAINLWFRHWVSETFGPLETMLAGDKRTGRFCHGDTPGMADICLYAQVLNNKRFGVDMKPYPTIQRIHDACLLLPAFQAAAPDKQPDAE
jgi:maleylpyruvate isomerase